MEPAWNFCESPEDTQEKSDMTNILERNREIEEENITSPLYSNGDGGGFSINEFHSTQLHLQDKRGELSENTEERKQHGRGR